MKLNNDEFKDFDKDEKQIIKDNAQKIFDLFKMLGNGEFDIFFYDARYGDAFKELEPILPFLEGDDIQNAFYNFEEEDKEKFFSKIEYIVKHSNIDEHNPIKLEDWYNECGKDESDVLEFLESNSDMEDVVEFLKEKNLLETYFNRIYTK